MNIFASLKSYAGKWVLKETRDFTEEELQNVESAIVVPSQYGNSVCFTMVGGNQKFLPLSTTSTLGVGDNVNMAKAKLITLGKPGEADIYRVEA